MLYILIVCIHITINEHQTGLFILHYTSFCYYVSWYHFIWKLLFLVNDYMLSLITSHDTLGAIFGQSNIYPLEPDRITAVNSLKWGFLTSKCGYFMCKLANGMHNKCCISKVTELWFNTVRFSEGAKINMNICGHTSIIQIISNVPRHCDQMKELLRVGSQLHVGFCY